MILTQKPNQPAHKNLRTKITIGNHFSNGQLQAVLAGGLKIPRQECTYVTLASGTYEGGRKCARSGIHTRRRLIIRSPRRLQGNRTVPRGYTEMLVLHNTLLRTAVEAMYHQLQRCHAWQEPALLEVDGHPLTYDFLAALRSTGYANEVESGGPLCITEVIDPRALLGSDDTQILRQSDWDDLDYVEAVTSTEFWDHRVELDIAAQEHVADSLFGTSLITSSFGPSPQVLSWSPDAPLALLAALPLPSFLIQRDGMVSWMQKTAAHAAQQSGAPWALPWLQNLDVNNVEQILQELDQASEWTARIPARSPIQTMDQTEFECPPQQDSAMALHSAGYYG